MAEHKFVYSVSGVDLSEAQQARISQAIGIAVAQVLTSGAPGTMRADFLSACKINGGRMIPPDEAERIGIVGVLADPVAVAGVR